MELRGATAVALTALVASSWAQPEDHPRAVDVSTSCTLSSVVATWRLERLAHQVLTVPAQETNARAAADQVQAGVGGILLFGSSAPADLGDDIRWLDQQARGGIAPLVMTDEEGGAVQRMANLVGWMPSARKMAATMTPDEVRALTRRVGGRMADAGVTMDLAPVLDLDDGEGPNEDDADGTRSFSIDPDVTTTYGLAFARGMRRAGVAPVVKHFPGLGEATTNPDFGPAWTQPWSDLQARGLRPFVAAFQAGLPAVMVTTARVPGLTSLPATLSHRVIQGVLRERLGFHRLVVTDSLTAGAITGAGFGLRRATVRALWAGADLVLFNAKPAEVASVTRSLVDAIVTAVRQDRLSLERLRSAVVHVLRAKQVSLCG